ncbi:MAG: hypothetical protein ACI83D_000564 [Planctomycetota bacterium]|jgi:hypothetical protein
MRKEYEENLKKAINDGLEIWILGYNEPGLWDHVMDDKNTTGVYVKIETDIYKITIAEFSGASHRAQGDYEYSGHAWQNPATLLVHHISEEEIINIVVNSHDRSYFKYLMPLGPERFEDLHVPYEEESSVVQIFPPEKVGTKIKLKKAKD